jgi:formyl-CoA transferase
MTMHQQPLAGIRVLEISAYISGPYTGALLAALGADVVKVEPPEGDAFRIGKGADSPFFGQYNSGKKSIAVDLKSSDGVAAVKALIPRFDVLIENMRPGKLASLGLGADVCRAINPRIVYTSISGFGAGGPWRDRPAYDSIGQSLGGFYTFMNDPGNVRLTGTCLADLITGISTVVVVLAGLVSRGQGSEHTGMCIETSVLEAVSLLTIDAMTQALDADIDPIRGTRHPQGQNFCLETASGDSVTLHMSSSQKFWRALATVVGRPDLIEDSRFRTYADRSIPDNYRALAKILEPEFRKQTFKEWERRLTAADVPFAPALTLRQLARHEQFQWLDMFDQSSRGKTLVRMPWLINGKRARRPTHVPEIGEHTREVLGEVISENDLEVLFARGAISAAKKAN